MAFPSREVSIDGNFGHRFPAPFLELFDQVAAGLEQGENAVGTTHVRGASDDKIRVTIANVAFNFQNPVTIPGHNQWFTEGRQIAMP